VERKLDVLVRAAADGERAAWEEIVDRFEGLVWATARAHRLSRADAADVAQTTWLRLVEHLDRIRDPERLPGWLATTARNESLRHLRLQARERPSDDPQVLELASDEAPDLGLLAGERAAAVWGAFARVGERCQALLRLLVSVTEPSYEEIGAALGMPIGAIGPTRMRCLEKLRREMTRGAAFQGGVA